MVGAGESAVGSRRASILADALEAVIGAIYLDGGAGAARRILLELYDDRLANLPVGEVLKDAKTRLQEALQARGLPLPEYRVSGMEGPDHAKRFHVICSIESLALLGEGEGTSRQRAEQSAAEKVLEAMDDA